MNFGEWLSMVGADPRMRQLFIIVAAIALAIVVRLVFTIIVRAITRRTATDVDDRIARELRRPVVLTILLVGVMLAHLEFKAPSHVDFIVLGVIQTVIGLLWAVTMMRVGRVVLENVSARVDQITWIEPKTLPLFEMILKVLVVGGFLYVVCIAWGIPLTSWLTSAGIVGIAVGFAAKDTLTNLFAGVYIVADAPYEVGDFVVLDERIRGEVIEIGMRSTRLLTRDDIEVTVPNAVIANAQIVNETGGPHEKMRVRVKVEAAYGSDVDQVREVLMGCIQGVGHLCDTPEPRVRFRKFGSSGLLFELLAWIDEPVFRGRVLDALHVNVYKAFNAAGIEIPYSKQDVYVKELPRREN